MLNWMTSIVSSLGYLGIVLLMFGENVFPPIPSEVIMPLAGLAAAEGKLRLEYVVIAGTAGSLLGALFWYYTGKMLGVEQLKSLTNRYGRWLTLSGKDVVKADRWFNNHGGRAVLLGRLIPGVRTLISVPAGISSMKMLKFLLYSAIGAGLWTALLAWAGYALGNNYHLFANHVGTASKVVVVGLVLALAVWVVSRRRRNRH